MVCLIFLEEAWTSLDGFKFSNSSSIFLLRFSFLNQTLKTLKGLDPQFISDSARKIHIWSFREVAVSFPFYLLAHSALRKVLSGLLFFLSWTILVNLAFKSGTSVKLESLNQWLNKIWSIPMLEQAPLSPDDLK